VQQSFIAVHFPQQRKQIKRTGDIYNKQIKSTGKGQAPPAPHATGTSVLLHFHPLVLYTQKAEEQSLRGKDKEF